MDRGYKPRTRSYGASNCVASRFEAITRCERQQLEPHPQEMRIATVSERAAERLNHGAKECVRGDITTNTVESFTRVAWRASLSTVPGNICAANLAGVRFPLSNRIGVGADDKDRRGRRC